jgi:hypothetical protein
MLCKGSKFLLTATSIAPILLTIWFLKFSNGWKFTNGLHYLIAAITLTITCAIIIYLSRKHLEKFPVKIAAVKTADKEIVGFVLVYLLPLINPTFPI